MLTINVKAELGDALKALSGFESQVPYATAKALTATAKDVQEALREEMKSAFQSPVPYTLNSLYLRRATKTWQEAEVGLKTRSRPEHYLMPQVQGGGRPLKRFEETLKRLGLMRADQRAVPAVAAKVNSYGNMPKSQIVEILSKLRSDASNGGATGGFGQRSKGLRASSVEYFVSRGKSSQRYGYGGRSRGIVLAQHLPAGVWVRHSYSRGSYLRPVLLFVSSTSYNKRYDFFGAADRVVKARFPLHIQASVQEALRTARLSQ